ncbi:MAG TPA: hydrogenase maturation nickel metallochaperone HypA [Candidatus Binataceae bacterium]|nr:hydrogenase maturation nickel metallochaperone HypA [Candidatus Binataceae bacterium]
MHELALTETIIATVAERVEGARVTRVVLHIGKLSGVVPEALQFCFDVCAAGTALQGASLEIIEIPGRATCLSCQSEIELSDIIGLCSCGSANLKMLSGNELRVKEVEVL